MAKQKAVFFCQECGYESPKWLGRCPGCEAWNSFVEEPVSSGAASRGGAGGGAVPPWALGAVTGAAGPAGAPAAAAAQPLRGVELVEEERLQTGTVELDRVLGGGLVPGSLVMVGGDPGIGKSTLLLQAGNALAHRYGTVLYVSGEESVRQTRLRAERIGRLSDRLLVLAECNLEEIARQIDQTRPVLAVVDSIQTVWRPDIGSAPGSVSQVRECAAALLQVAKSRGVAVALVGHVNKAGDLAGPRVLEHIVDAVLHFEGERHHSYRILRGAKNRFGPTHEIGVFEMRDSGLHEVPNPSQLLLAQRPQGVAGSAVVASLEGTRPILAEVQALVGPAALGVARRTTSGVDPSRVSLLMAVLEKRCGMHLSGHDAFLKITGGLRLEEPAIDLGLAIALASSYREQPVDPHTVVCGEVGLAGEVRSVARLDQRLREAERLGFRRCIVPRGAPAGSQGKLQIIGVETVGEAIQAAVDA